MRAKANVHFSEPSEPQKKAIRRRVYRYWSVYKDVVAGLIPWTRWYENSGIKLPEPHQTEIQVLDIIDNKVIRCNGNLRDLHVIASRRWPLKEKMLEVMADRAKAKKSRRNLAKFAKEMEG